MQRRTFIQAVGGASLLATEVGNAQSIGQTLSDAPLQLLPWILPRERIEKRIYDRSKSDLVVWHLEEYMPRYGKKLIREMVGYIEALTTPEKILSISVPRVDASGRQTDRKGFYFIFRLGWQWHALPKRSLQNPSAELDRYAVVDTAQRNAYAKGIDGGVISCDLRQMKFIEGQKTSHPTHVIAYEGQIENTIPHDAKLYLKPLTAPLLGSLRREYAGFLGDYFFETNMRPIRFKLELPPLIIQGLEVPMPTCFFEPYDELNGKWVGE